MEHIVSWIWRKLDTFLSAVVMTLTGIIASQTQAFITQYLQRLGGHLDEAEAQFANIQTGSRYKLMDETVRVELKANAQSRIDDLQSAYDSIGGADIFMRPFSFFGHAEPAIVTGTWSGFTPALPLDMASIIYVLMGMILGFLVYELIKLPIFFFARRSDRRRFRHRS